MRSSLPPVSVGESHCTDTLTSSAKLLEMECLRIEGDSGGSIYVYIRVYIPMYRQRTKHSPTNRIVEDPIVVRVGSGSTQDTVIPFSAVLDRVDVNVVSLAAISVTV